MKRLLLLLTAFVGLAASLLAQTNMVGTVTDAKTGERLPFVNVIYVNGQGTKTDFDGCFSIPFRQGAKLRVSVIGYETRTLTLKTPPSDTLRVRLTSMEKSLGTAEVTGKKTKYSRKNNPAVEL